MSDAIRKLHDYLAKSPSVVYPEDVLAYLPAIEEEKAKMQELVRNLWPFVKAGWVSACPNRECCLFEECDADSEYECLIEEHVVRRMRELGVEVDYA